MRNTSNKTRSKHGRYVVAKYYKNREEFFAGKCCVWCGSTKKLEIDHIDPLSKGGRSSCWLWSAEKRQAELAKCRVLCWRCHHKRHGPSRMKPLIHGTGNAYWRKRCRCAKCKEFARNYMDGYRAGVRLGDSQAAEPSLRTNEPPRPSPRQASRVRVLCAAGGHVPRFRGCLRGYAVGG